jgi:hypothetical protein
MVVECKEMRVSFITKALEQNCIYGLQTEYLVVVNGNHCVPVL